MRRWRVIETTGMVLGLLASVARAGVGSAQTSALETTLRGVAYDSLRAAPLRGALITLAGTTRSAVTDARGAFQVEQVPVGRYTVVLQHDVLDSLGLSDIHAPITVTDTPRPIVISVPSFATLWRNACGARAVPADSGFLFGTVREAVAGTPLADAAVTVRFTSVAYTASAGLRQDRWRAETRTNADGAYVLCGLPQDVALQFVAAKGEAATDAIDLPLRPQRLQRVDLLVPSASSGSALSMVLRGMIRYRTNGAPAGGVRVVTATVPETRTTDDGRFVLPGVPLGTRQVEVLAVGATPVRLTLDLAPTDTTAVSVLLDRVTTLTDVTVRASVITDRRIADMEQRRATGTGRFLDSTAIARYASVATALGTIAFRTGRVCAVFMDGVEQPLDSTPLQYRSPADLAQLEVHRGSQAPLELVPRKLCRAQDYLVVVWTKAALPPP